MFQEGALRYGDIDCKHLFYIGRNENNQLLLGFFDKINNFGECRSTRSNKFILYEMIYSNMSDYIKFKTANETRAVKK